MLEACELRLGIGRVDIHEPELLELAGANAAFGVEGGRAYMMHDLQRLFPREDRGARIALLLGIAPILHVSRQVKLYLTLLELGLLQGEHIGVEGGERLVEALLHNGAQAVHVP